VRMPTKLKSAVAQAKAAELQQRYEFVDTAGLPEDEAVLKWIEAVMKRELPRPLHAALLSGAVLCQLVNVVRPGTVPEKLCEESSKTGSQLNFEQRARIDGYLTACNTLGIKLKFVTADLHDGTPSGLKAAVRQMQAFAAAAMLEPGFPGPMFGDARAQAAAKAELVKALANLGLEEKMALAAEKAERQRERKRRQIETDIRNEERMADRVLLEKLRKMQEEEEEALALSLLTERQDAIKAAELEKKKAHDKQVGAYTISTFLYKRGADMTKNWKKRWCLIEDGVLYYYPDASDKQKGKSPLGALNLLGSSVRPPTSIKGKGKYASTCFRLDLDERYVGKNAAMPPQEEEDDERRSDARRTKYILAAESVQGMRDWMDAIEFWSRYQGATYRRSILTTGLSEDQMLLLRQESRKSAMIQLQSSRTSIPSLPDDDNPDEEQSEEEMEEGEEEEEEEEEEA